MRATPGLIPLVLSLTILSVAGLALADGDASTAQQAHGDIYLTAREPTDEVHDPWNTTMEALKADHSPVVRALQTPEEAVAITQEEHEAMRPFWDTMSDHDALLIEGDHWEILLIMEGHGDGDDDTAARPVSGDASSGTAGQAPMRIVASHPPPGEPATPALVLTRAELQERYPPAALALETPERLVEVPEGQEAHIHQLYEDLEAGGYAAFEIDGEAWMVSIAEAAPGVPPSGDAAATGDVDAQGEATSDASFLGLAVFLGVSGMAALVWRPR